MAILSGPKTILQDVEVFMCLSLDCRIYLLLVGLDASMSMKRRTQKIRRLLVASMVGRSKVVKSFRPPSHG